ncbi:MAG: hypothetical protein K6F56_08970, partial [Oscillospiraceae bacterium]|nr:hypothetical protein [Oscillospiraceae bacterium]
TATPAAATPAPSPTPETGGAKRGTAAASDAEKDQNASPSPEKTEDTAPVADAADVAADANIKKSASKPAVTDELTPAESAAPTAEPAATEPPAAGRRIMMSPRRTVSAAAPEAQSTDTAVAPEVSPEPSESPAPSASPEPSESPAPSAAPEPSETPAPSAVLKPVKRVPVRVEKEENRRRLQILLAGTEAAMPEDTADVIYELQLISSDAYGSEEKLSIRVFGSEVYYLSTVSGTSRSFSAKCSPDELEALIDEIKEDELVPASPSPSPTPIPTPTPVPTVTPDPYLETPEPDAPEQK